MYFLHYSAGARRRARTRAAAALSALCALLMATSAAAATRGPNVIFIMTDDAGYGDLSLYESPDVDTPNLDRMSRQGVVMTDFYANAPVCSPTRAGLISGRYQQRVNIESPLGRDRTIGLPVTGRSLPQLLKNNGYRTALMGKWHIGDKPEFSPNAHGFEEFFGFKLGYIDYYQHDRGPDQPDLWENDKPVKVEGYMTDLITDRSIEFVQSNKDQPFFLSVQFNAPHWPYQRPNQPSVSRNNAAHLQPWSADTNVRGDYIAMLEHVDHSIGRILQTLDDLGIAENTLVIYTNDNGGEWLANNRPFFNRKFSVWEGGIRVPAIVRWPGRIPAGTVSHQVGITMDFTATILAATNTTVPAEAKLDGMNLLPMLDGSKPEVARTLFWRAPNQNERAVRRGDWKLVTNGGATFLFNLHTDLAERDDLANRRQDIARELWGLLGEWEADVNAEAIAGGFRKPEQSARR